MALPIKAWLRFYFQLVLAAGWNGVINFFYVFSGGAIATAAHVVDIRTIGMNGAMYILLGTVLANIGGSLYVHKLPDPIEPKASE